MQSPRAAVRRRVKSPDAPILLAEGVIPLSKVPLSKRGSMLDVKKIKDEAAAKFEQNWLDLKPVSAKLMANPKIKVRSACFRGSVLS
jgi:hypothetical protein